MKIDTVRELVGDGAMVDYKKVSICNLRSYMPQRAGMYQVHSENGFCRFSQIYWKVEEALDKFFELVKEADKKR